ncbi:hypothetical protein FKM82_027326 [Ascaphus truei]
MAEKLKCDLGEELEALKTERDATLDSTAAQQEVSQLTLEKEVKTPRQTLGSQKQSMEKMAVELKQNEAPQNSNVQVSPLQEKVLARPKHLK